MATPNSALEKICSHLECSICSERFKQPKVLDCLHSYCEKCLERYIQGAPNVSCPLCRQETVLPEKGVQGLKTNHHLIGMVDEMTLQEKIQRSPGHSKPMCEVCDKGNEATRRCLDCAQNICSTCNTLHLRCAATSNHAVATLEDIRQGKVAVKRTLEDGSTCQHHKGEVKRFYCETCEEPICRDCTVLKHCKPQHRYIEASEAYLKYKQSMTDALKACNTDINLLKEYVTVTSQAKQKLKKNVTRAVKDVQDRVAQIMAEFRVEGNRLIHELQYVEYGRNKAFDEQLKRVFMMLERKQHSLKTAQDVTDAASEIDFLSLYPVIRKDLRAMLSNPNCPAIDLGLSCLKFKQSRGNSDINLGELDLTSAWELHRELGMGDLRGARGIDATRPGEIAVADTLNERVAIISTEGRRKVKMSAGKFPRDVAGTNDWLVVVDNTSYVKMYRRDNTLDFQFPTLAHRDDGKTEVDLRSVTVKKDGTVIVGDVKRMVLTEHRPHDGELIRTIPVQIEPYFLAVDNNGKLLISGWTDKVVVARGNGATLRTIKPIIGGYVVEYCKGVCSDLSGFYIAVRGERFGTGHIHHYNGTGTFLRCIAQDLYDPQGIACTADGQLAVTDVYSVKIYHEV